MILMVGKLRDHTVQKHITYAGDLLDHTIPVKSGGATPHPRYVPMSAAATYAGFSVRTLRRYIAQGRLTGYRVGPKHIRVDLNDVDGMFSAISTANSAL